MIDKTKKVQQMEKTNKNWSRKRDTKSLLLDTGSTFLCVNSSKMLVHIRKCDKLMNGVSNGRVMVKDREGELPEFFKVYYNSRSLMNIISFKDMRNRFKITVDTSKEYVFWCILAKAKL